VSVKYGKDNLKCTLVKMGYQNEQDVVIYRVGDMSKGIKYNTSIKSLFNKL